MRSKRIITLLLVLSFVVTLLSSCAETGNKSKAETTENSIQSPETPDITSEAKEQIEDTTEDKTEQTEKPAEETFPGGYDEETYKKLKDALVVLDDDTKAEIASKIKEFSGLDVRGWADESFSRWLTLTRCYGGFENCIVILYPMYGVTAVMGHDKIAGYEFWLSTRFYLFGYCNGTLYMLNEAYQKGFISKDEIAIVSERHDTVEAYR